MQELELSRQLRDEWDTRIFLDFFSGGQDRQRWAIRFRRRNMELMHRGQGINTSTIYVLHESAGERWRANLRGAILPDTLEARFLGNFKSSIVMFYILP